MSGKTPESPAGPPVGFAPPTTPALVVRRAAMERNLAAMQHACDAANVRLRAHGNAALGGHAGLDDAKTWRIIRAACSR